MQLLGTVPLEKLTPSRVWAELDPETKSLAARTLLARGEETANREEANLAIASALRFRVQAVRQLPLGGARIEGVQTPVDDAVEAHGRAARRNHGRYNHE